MPRSEIKKRLSQIGSGALLGIAGLAALSSGVLAHAGFHYGDSVFSDILYWFWEPDHLLMLTIAFVAMILVKRHRRRPTLEDELPR